MQLDPILITSGDPAGIGPEVTHKAVMKQSREGGLLRRRPLIVIGDAFLYSRHLARHADMQRYLILPVDEFLDDCDLYMQEAVPPRGGHWRPIFVDCGQRDEHKIKLGKAQRAAGERACTYLAVALQLMTLGFFEYLLHGADLQGGRKKAGFKYPGQTELFGDVFGVERPVMMMVGGGLRVTLVTIHEPLRGVFKKIRRRTVMMTIRATAEALKRDFGILQPRIAVCGLNPHAGEDGAFGLEERRSISPAVKLARRVGIDVTGPLAADSIYSHACKGRYDAVVAMYHDQGLVAVKTLAFESGVNVTIGLPVVRTAPDHGTAFDIAGKDQADETAMLAALRLCHELSEHRAKADPV